MCKSIALKWSAVASLLEMLRSISREAAAHSSSVRTIRLIIRLILRFELADTLADNQADTPTISSELIIRPIIRLIV